MAIDTTIQYSGRNSFRVTDMLWQWPFYVTDMTHITHSFQAMCDVAQASGVRAKTKFIDSTGGQMSEVSHSFAVGVTFELKTITVPVPSGASMAILGFIQGNRTWWVAEPKSEQGETATPFNVNYQGQLSFMTPTGLYTGFIRANQILVTGSPSQPGEQLEQRLVTINQNVVNLSASVSGQNSRITNMEAGQASFVKFDDLGTPDGTYINGGNIKTGKIQSVSGASYFDLTNGEIKSNNVDLTGKITATSGNVGGLVIGANDLTITVSKVFGPFSQTDLDRVMDIFMRYITPTAADYDKYDFFGSGRLTSLNNTVIYRMINGTHGLTNPMTITYQVVFSTSGTNNLITLKNSLRTETTVIRPASVETSHGRYATLEATNIDAMSFGSNGNVGATGSFKAKNASGNEITVTVTGGLITSIG